MLMRSSSADLMGGCRACRRATARVCTAAPGTPPGSG